jgi:hypothetical protein
MLFRLLCQLERFNREKKLESKLRLNIKPNRLRVTCYTIKDIITLDVLLLTNTRTLFTTIRPNPRQTREKHREKTREILLTSTVEIGRLRTAQGTKTA